MNQNTDYMRTSTHIAVFFFLELVTGRDRTHEENEQKRQNDQQRQNSAEYAAEPSVSNTLQVL